MSKKVYFSQDGGVDDIISLFLLLQMDDVDLIGVGVMGADSYLQPAAEASRKVIDRFGHGKKLEVAYSNARAVHPFPTKWRLDAYSENSLPILNESGEIKTPKAPLAADDDLIEKLMNSNEPVTLLFTGPLSDLASALKKKPEIEDKIVELMWMGGTFQERGNVAEPDCDGTQEWNAFWDPEAVSAVFSSSIKITMVALESTHNVPLTPAVRMSWAKDRRYPGIDFIGNSYAFVPELSMFETNSTYFLWDVLTTCALEDPTLIKQKTVKCSVYTDFPRDGRTYLDDNGREAQLVYDVDNKRFFDMIKELGKKTK